ncbi:hypothetical protein DL98DRAFT_275148, partial [Cadophora sp. DSE1049]
MAHQDHQVPMGDTEAAAYADGGNRGTQGSNVVAHRAEHQQKVGTKDKKVDSGDLARHVPEEIENKAKLPRYPGLERWQLIEKLGDGAFSNVYKARDLDGKAGEVAIKIVRKFELSSRQRAYILKEAQIM